MNIPQATDIEAIVLGQILYFPKAIDEVVNRLTHEHFYHPSHSIIFKCCKWLHDTKKPIEYVTVIQALKDNKYLDSIGGAYFITKLTDNVLSPDNIEKHCDMLIEKKMLRDVITIASSTLTEAYNPQCKIADLIDKYEKNLTEITTNLTGNNIASSREIYANMIERNSLILANNGKLGVTSGFNGIDKITAGWQEPDLIILAARPGMGKSSLAAQLVTSPSITQGKSVALFTLEMSTSQFYARMQSQQSGIPVEKILRTGLNEYEMSQLTNNCAGLIGAPIFIDDTAGISIFDLKNKCRKLKREKNLGLIVVDYLQLITVPDHKGNREQEIGIISRSLKNMAKELKVPVIALSQLSRAVELRQDKRPMLSDLRESGSIEMDADVVSFLYRPEYYGIMQDEKGNSTSGLAMFIIAKHRNGPLADVMLTFEHEKTKFTDYQPYMNYYK